MGYKFSEEKELEENKRKFLTQNSFTPDNTVCMSVQMGTDINFVSLKDKGKGLTKKANALPCDALITTSPNVNLFLVVADCLPIIIFDNKLGILSLIHSSWGNTDRGIVKKVLKEFRKLKSNINDIQVIIGPGIQKDSLIYDKNIFNKITSDWGEYIKQIGEEQYSIDNVGYTIKQLEEEGIQKSNIKIHDIDTFKDERYFSL